MTITEMRQKKQEYGLTYEMISERSGVPLGTVQKIFGGKTESPRHGTLEALEKMFRELGRHGGESGSMLNETMFKYRAGDGGYTIEDYETWPDEDRCELIDGKVYMMTAPTTAHQMMILRLAVRFSAYTDSKGKDCIAGIAPTDFQLRGDDDRTIVQPDVYIVCSREKNIGRRFLGAPDLAVEVLSPSTAAKDMGIKLKKYLEAGVREYWMVNYEEGYIFVNDFEHDAPMRIYGIRDEVPVAITGGELTIDFAEIDDYIKAR